MGRWNKRKWLFHYYSAKSRCDAKYAIYNVHFDLTRDDVEYLWKRDNAHLLKKPSIDRINTLGNYSVLNCRFIENYDNKKRIRRKSIFTQNRFKGVSYQEDHKKFRAIINGKHLGYFSSEKEAARAYDIEAIKLTGFSINHT